MGRYMSSGRSLLFLMPSEERAVLGELKEASVLDNNLYVTDCHENLAWSALTRSLFATTPVCVPRLRAIRSIECPGALFRMWMVNT